VQIRRSALAGGVRTLGYPSLVNVAALAPGQPYLQAALASLFTLKYGSIIVLDKLEIDEGKTRIIVKMLKDLGANKKALIVIPEKNENIRRATANIQGIKTAYVNTLNVLDILGYDKFIVTQDAVRLVEEVYN
jgi:large subunit ribosomal protein L4